MGIGYVPQNRMIDGANRDAGIWENCIMGYHIAHGFKSKTFIDHKQAYSFTDEVVRKFSVKTPSIQTKISALSGGNVQKTIVGREFLQNNRLLIIQDPTRGIDIGAIEFIWKKIEELAAQGAAVLLVSQELNEVMEMSDRLLVMYGGRLFDAGKHGELSEQQIGLLMTGGGESC
jgi:simple sugar transport system ATP-binding protein